MTAPYLSDTPEVIKQSHSQVVRASITHPDLIGTLPLELTGVQFSFDETSAPRAICNIECVATVSPVPVQIDPRTGVRLSLETGYVHPGGLEDVHEILDVGVRQITRNEASGTYSMMCAGDEALVIDASPVISESTGAVSHSSAIQVLLARSISPHPSVALPTGAVGGSVSVTELTDRWQAMADIADRVDAEVYDDGLRTFVMRPRPVLAGPTETPAHSLTVGENGTVLDVDSSLTRENWYNHVTLVYEWRDASDVDHHIEATAYVLNGKYRITGPAGKKSLIDRRYMETTQSEADAAARAILDRGISKSTSHELKAVAAYWLRPGMTVSLTLPNQAPALHLVSSVSFDPFDGTMRLVTRLPDTVIVTNGTVGTPDPEPPAVQKYVSTWTSNGTEAYLQSGNRWNNTEDMVQGYVSGAGNNQGIGIFTAANSTGDDTGKSISTALSGLVPDDISKVEVYLYAHHWWYFAGGTARIGFYSGSSLPSTFTGANPFVTVANWKRDSGRWVNITSPAVKASLISGGRGVTVGPGKGTSAKYYGRFSPAGSSHPPKLRITYSKAV